VAVRDARMQIRSRPKTKKLSSLPEKDGRLENKEKVPVIKITRIIKNGRSAKVNVED